MTKQHWEMALALSLFVGSMVVCMALAHAGIILVVMP